MIHDGNRSYATRGVEQQQSAFGIVGFVRFTEGYYIVLITKRRKVATIGYHVIYKIVDTCIVRIYNNLSSRGQSSNEAKYVKIFQNVDLSSNFYFSYTYDLSQPLQSQMRSIPGSVSPATKFIWNQRLLKSFTKHRISSRWVIRVIHGFICQKNISVFGKYIYLTLIARRSKQFAGTRYLKRGTNDEGDVANEVETEQIVHDASTSWHSTGKITSYLQLRGSVPCFWSQEFKSGRIKPQIIVDRATPFASPAARHFASCMERFGSPIIVFNLVKRREHRKREMILTQELEGQINYLNQFLPPDQQIQYYHKDMAKINKSRNINLIEVLEDVANKTFAETGFFHAGPELCCHQFDPHREYCSRFVSGEYIGRGQRGIVRVNCVDCLDRTNTAQFIVGKCALGYQLYAIGVTDTPVLEFECDTMRMFEAMYEDLGDTLAVQYGGSQLVHRIKTYRRTAHLSSHSRDIYQTVQRYYRNAFTDADKQQAINLFLGMFKPHPERPNLWELPTDYYLHHSQTNELPSKTQTYSYTKWWLDKVVTALPYPYVEGSVPTRLQEVELMDIATAFWQLYPPNKYIEFGQTFDYQIERCCVDYAPSDAVDLSPFTVRDTKNASQSQKPSRKAIVGLYPGPKEAEQDSSDDELSSEDDEPRTDSRRGSNLSENVTEQKLSEIFSCQEVYGFSFKDPTPADVNIYNRYTSIYQLSVCPNVRYEYLTRENCRAEDAQWIPCQYFTADSNWGMEPVIVSEANQKVYEISEVIGNYGPPRASLNFDIYDSYVHETIT
ncbi:polyphosphoinositide phosphatase-like isoform X2 [Dysidea avara]